MNNYFKITLLLSCFYVTSLFSQKNSEKGDRYFDQNQFESAIKYYLLETKSGNKKASEHSMRRLADCYRIIGEFEKAEDTYRKILKRKKKDPVNYLNYGLSLKSSAKYAEAIVQFNEYIILKPDDPMGKIFLVSCDSAQKWLDETIGKEVKNIEKINTEFSEFSPVLYSQNKLLFSSSRQGSKEALISFDGGGEMHRLDLFSIDMNLISTKDNTKTDIVNFKDINSPMHEGSACFSRDGKDIYFTKTVKGKKDSKTNGILYTLQIYYSKMDSTGKWSNPISAFEFNSMEYSVGHPSLSNDEKTIYYMSDKPGGFGKTDIYYSIKQQDEKWGKPINAGNLVNTFGYELFPYISESGKLYFSSNSHPGMGQLDIFCSAYIDNKWSNVQNLKPPINSIGNDFGITLDGKDNRGFFSSDRFNGKGAEDIYSFSDEIPLNISLSNDTLKFPDKNIFDDSKYKLINEKDSSETELSSATGFFFLKLENNTNYTLVSKKNGFPYNKINLNLLTDTLTDNFELKLKASSKAIAIEGFSTSNKKNVSTEKRAIYISKNENKDDSIYIEVDNNNCFKFNDLIEPEKQYILFSKLINP